MIWLFKVDEVFRNNEPKVNQFYLFDTDDIEFDITKYDISLYFPTSDYYLLSDLNPSEIYFVRLQDVNRNPIRLKVPDNTKIYKIITEFFIKENREIKLNLLN